MQEGRGWVLQLLIVADGVLPEFTNRQKKPNNFFVRAAVTSQRVLKQHHRKCPRAPRTSSDQLRPAHHGKSLLAVKHLLPAALQTAAEVARCSCVVGLTVFIQRQSTFRADRIYEAVLHLL